MKEHWRGVTGVGLVRSGREGCRMDDLHWAVLGHDSPGRETGSSDESTMKTNTAQGYTQL